MAFWFGRLLGVSFGMLLVGLAAGAESVFESGVIGNPPAQVVAGIGSAGALWAVEGGEIEIKDDGELEVEIRGLVLGEGPAIGTIGGVLEVIASLHCSVGGPGEELFEEVGRSDDAPLDENGDTEIEFDLSLPGQCVAPVVLVRITVFDGAVIGLPPGPVRVEDLGAVPPWIAASGF